MTLTIGSRRRERIRALGNSVVPQCAEVIGRVVAAQHKGDDTVTNDRGKEQ